LTLYNFWINTPKQQTQTVFRFTDYLQRNRDEDFRIRKDKENELVVRVELIILEDFSFLMSVVFDFLLPDNHSINNCLMLKTEKI